MQCFAVLSAAIKHSSQCPEPSCYGPVLVQCHAKLRAVTFKLCLASLTMHSHTLHASVNLACAPSHASYPTCSDKLCRCWPNCKSSVTEWIRSSHLPRCDQKISFFAHQTSSKMVSKACNISAHVQWDGIMATNRLLLRPLRSHYDVLFVADMTHECRS